MRLGPLARDLAQLRPEFRQEPAKLLAIFRRYLDANRLEADWSSIDKASNETLVNALPIVAVMTRTVSASGMDWGTLAAAGVLTIVPGAIVIWFVRHYIAKGFAMGRV